MLCRGRVGHWKYSVQRVFPGGSVVENPPANAEDTGSIPDLGRSLKKEVTAHSSTLAWEILWTEEPGGLQSMGLQRVLHNWASDGLMDCMDWFKPWQAGDPGRGWCFSLNLKAGKIKGPVQWTNGYIERWMSKYIILQHITSLRNFQG